MSRQIIIPDECREWTDSVLVQAPLRQKDLKEPTVLAGAPMKEWPILFTPENAQKSHDGLKTETRRLNGLDEINESPNDWAVLCHSPDDIMWRFAHRTKTASKGGGLRAIKCPYGVVGDRLWIREACWVYGRWKPNGRRGNKQRSTFETGTTGRQCTFTKPLQTQIRRKGELGWGWVRRPGIYMPRWACRTVLEIIEIRVERLNSISEEDAVGEGCSAVGPEKQPSHGTIGGKPYRTARFPVAQFAALWESINGPGSWDENPWVWAITFKKEVCSDAKG